VLCFFCLFFFSSRRRHTRSKRDWSSDVCSSDLLWEYSYFINEVRENQRQGLAIETAVQEAQKSCIEKDILKEFLEQNSAEVSDEIGRASCRERVEMRVVVGRLEEVKSRKTNIKR